MPYQGWSSKNTWLVAYVWNNNKFLYDKRLKTKNTVAAIKELILNNKHEVITNYDNVNWQELCNHWSE